MTTDVVVWMDTGSGPWVAPCVRSVKKFLKLDVRRWFLAGESREKVERLAYDLGMTPLFYPVGQIAALVEALKQTEGASSFLVIADHLILLADWNPGTLGQLKAWPGTPVSWMSVDEIALPGPGPQSFFPANQVQVMTWAQFEIRPKDPFFGAPKAILLSTKS